MNILIKNYLLMLMLLLAGAACTDVIEVELPQGDALLVVDGQIYDSPGPYTINLSTTAPYFGDAQTPRAAGAQVQIQDSEGFSEILREVAPGQYQTQHIQGKQGNSYTLSIQWEGQSYQATTSIRPGAQIDSLTYKYQPAKGGQDEGYFLYFFGNEIPGEGDHYQVRLYKNGQYLNKPSDLTYVSDQMVEGNYIHDLLVNWKPFAMHDEVRVEMLVITEDHYQFLLELNQQTSNGGMFPNPSANVRTNVVNTSSKGPKAVGYFGGASVAALAGTINQETGVIKP